MGKTTSPSPAVKEPVRLRQREMPSGNRSLYLDIYIDGRRSYEYLHLYLIPERNRADRDRNRDTLRLAEAVRSKRLLEIRNGEFGFRDNRAAQTRFFDYFEQVCYRKRVIETGRRPTSWMGCLEHLRIYEKRPDITLAQISPEWVRGFREYLDREALTRGNNKIRPIAQNTKGLYFGKLHAVLNLAVADGILDRNPMTGIAGFPKARSQRMYLTADEIRKLAATRCSDDVAKRAFLFSCLTGLRVSDIRLLTWGQVYRQGEFTRIMFRQKKTKENEYLDISPNAAALMGERGRDDDPVFRGLQGDIINLYIREWVARAGIDKHITFHCARHSFAVMMLDLGTDIYTVSKLLGHREVSTTQIYAKILDKNKQNAVMRIPDLIHPSDGDADGDGDPGKQ